MPQTQPVGYFYKFRSRRFLQKIKYSTVAALKLLIHSCAPSKNFQYQPQHPQQQTQRGISLTALVSEHSRRTIICFGLAPRSRLATQPPDIYPKRLAANTRKSGFFNRALWRPPPISIFFKYTVTINPRQSGLFRRVHEVKAAAASSTGRSRSPASAHGSIKDQRLPVHFYGTVELTNSKNEVQKPTNLLTRFAHIRAAGGLQSNSINRQGRSRFFDRRAAKTNPSQSGSTS